MLYLLSFIMFCDYLRFLIFYKILKIVFNYKNLDILMEIVVSEDYIY